MEDSQLPFVSVIVPIRNEADFIEKCIQSIIQMDYPKNQFEILVVDGMSDDGTREIIQKLMLSDGRIKLLDNPRKTVPFAMNIGIRIAKGDLFTRIDGHVTVPLDFLKNSVACLAEHNEAWVAGGYIQTIADNYVGQAISAAMKSPIGVGNSRFRIGDYEGCVDTLAFGTHYKWIVDKIGYFDEQLVRNQDDEFNFRIVQAGGKIWLSKSICCDYFARSSLKKLWMQYYQYGFWRIRTIQKHCQPATIRQMIPLLFVSILLLLLVGGLFWHKIWFLLLVLLCIYTLGLMAGAMHVALKSKLIYALLAPIVFSILHFAYGIGCLWGIVRFILLKGVGLPKPEEFKLSR